MLNFGDFIVYADESGDHGLETINPENPAFVLSFCIFQKKRYSAEVVPSIQDLKFHFWGHDCVVLHSHEIRHRRNDFRILNDRDLRQIFMDRVNDTISSMPVTVIAAAIDKARLRARYARPANPYAMSLAFCIERLQRFLGEHRQIDRLTHILVECRGKKEDEALELEFRRMCDGGTYAGRIQNLDIRFMDKKHNSSGLQVADLISYPISRHVLKPLQSNRSYEIVQKKFRRNASGNINGYGLKVFP